MLRWAECLEVVRLSTAPHGARHVLLVLATHADRAGYSEPSTARIAELCGIGIRSVQRQLRVLESLGEITVIHRPGHRSTYWLAAVTPDASVAPTGDATVAYPRRLRRLPLTPASPEGIEGIEGRAARSEGIPTAPADAKAPAPIVDNNHIFGTGYLIVDRTCTWCEGTAWVLDDHGTAQPCDCQKP